MKFLCIHKMKGKIMKKTKFCIIPTALLLAAGGISTTVATSNDFLVAHALEEVDCGVQNIYINEIDKGSIGGLYVLANTNDTLPYNGDWSLAYTPVGSTGAITVNGEDKTINGPLMKKLGNDRFYIDLAGSATQGDIVTVAGDWHYSDGEKDYKFTISPALTMTYVNDTTLWDYALEDYERVSLLDAGMPNYEYTSINNEYGLDDYDKTRLNHFSLKNNTNSFVFEFEVEAKAKEDSEFNLRLGAKTNNWGLDHTIKLNMNGTWGPNGVMEMFDEVGGTPTKLRDFDINIAPGAKHTLGIGIVKVKNSTGHLLFVENDGAVVGRKFAKLNDKEMGTRAAFYYTGSNYAVRNTIEQEYGEEILAPSSNPNFTDQNYYRYFYTKTDLIPELNSWIDYGMCYDPSNITLNGNPIFAADAINYMKKVDTTTYFINLPDKSTFKVGDVLTIGGSFKFMQDYSIYHDAEGNVVNRDVVGRTLITPDYVARKMSVKKESFTWTGSKFILKADYDAAKTAANAVDAQIDAIGKVTLDKETAINAARTAYTELDDEAKELVTKLSVLEAAEARLAELKTAKADAEAFDAKVTAIGEVTLESEAAITDARNTYEALSDDAKAMVTKLSDLEAAEAALAGLKLDATKAEAKAELDNIDLNAYREVEKATVQGYIAEGKQAIDAAVDADEVNTAKGDALDKIATVKTDAQLTLEEAKDAAKAELDAIDLSVYRDEQKEQVQSVINAAKETIDQDTTVEGVEETLSGALALIDLVKTDAELTLEEAKAAAKAEITAKYEELTTKNSYSEENSAKLAKAKDDALAAIDAATTVEAVGSAKEAGLTAMNEIPVYVAPKKGCGGSIAATSIILSSLALAGLGLVALKKKKED